jgi:response regulator NasT
MHSSNGRTADVRFSQLRVAVLDAEVESREQLVSAIAGAGLEVCVEGPPRPSIVGLIHRAACDAALVGIDDPAGSPIRLAPNIECALILCSQNTGPDMMVAARKMGAMGFLVRPIRSEQIVPTLALATSIFREGQPLRRTLAERKTIEQAKGRVMERRGMTEDAAFRWLRRRAMDTRTRIADVARDVLSGQNAREGTSG